MMTPFDTSKLWIGGEWVPSSDGRTLSIENPSTGLTVGAIGRATPDDVDAAVSAAESALSGAWGALTAFERGRLLNRLSDLVLAHTELLTELEVADVGKPVSQARADVVALARYLEFYAGAADKLHGQTIPFLADYTVYTLREPHGVTESGRNGAGDAAFGIGTQPGASRGGRYVTK
jgi:aldehyde dehydrogenase (NAD+)